MIVNLKNKYFLVLKFSCILFPIAKMSSYLKIFEKHCYQKIVKIPIIKKGLNLNTHKFHYDHCFFKSPKAFELDLYFLFITENFY